MRLGRVAALALGLSALSGSAEPVRAPADVAVRAAMANFIDALNALDVERLATQFTEDVTAFVPLARPERVEGKPAVVEIFRAFAARTRETTPRLNIVPEGISVEASSDLGIVSFQVRGPATVNRRSFVFRRSGDAWLICHFHASDFSLVAR